MREVAVLFARADSIYKTMPGCDVWDIERDARRWPGGGPAVAHPPCRAWGRLRVGIEPDDLPAMPRREGRATHCIRPTKAYPRLPSVTKAEREHTPTDLAVWLVELARRCNTMKAEQT